MFRRDLEEFVYNKTGPSITMMPKDIITKFDYNNKPESYMTNLILAVGKLLTQKTSFSKSFPNFDISLVELNLYINKHLTFNTLTLMTNKQTLLVLLLIYYLWILYFSYFI